MEASINLSRLKTAAARTHPANSNCSNSSTSFISNHKRVRVVSVLLVIVITHVVLATAAVEEGTLWLSRASAEASVLRRRPGSEFRVSSLEKP